MPRTGLVLHGAESDTRFHVDDGADGTVTFVTIEPQADVSYTADDRAAMRAFLQRCEVRLSTMHRVATALLSGAGILVLLPALERDAVVQVLRALLAGPISWSQALLAVGVVGAMGLALSALWFVVLELTRFYFHSNHVRTEMHDGAHEVFTARFTLTGLRLPADELSPAAAADYALRHSSSDNVELLVAKNQSARDQIDRQMAAYPGLIPDDVPDADTARAEALFALAASRQRSLAEEVMKVEYGIVRHANRLQVIVLRYVKALLVIVVTSLASYASAAVLTSERILSAADERWIAGVLLVWAPVVVLVAAAPVRWLDRLLRAEGAQGTALGADRELTQVEDITVRVALVVWVLAAVASGSLLVDHPVSDAGRVAALVVLVASAVGMVVVTWQRRERSRLPRSAGTSGRMVA